MNLLPIHAILKSTLYEYFYFTINRGKFKILPDNAELKIHLTIEAVAIRIKHTRYGITLKPYDTISCVYVP